MKATPTTRGAEGQRVPRASRLTRKALDLPSRTWATTTSASFSIRYLKLEEQEGVVPGSCIDLSGHLATEATSTPCLQGHFWGESSPDDSFEHGTPCPSLNFSYCWLKSRTLPARLGSQCMCLLTLSAGDSRAVCLFYISKRTSAEGSFPQ